MKIARAFVLAWWLSLAHVGFLSAADRILTWAGAEHDPHPCLYVTAKDAAEARAKRRDQVAALAGARDFNLDGALDQAIAAALLADNAEARKLVAESAPQALDALLAGIRQTLEKGVGPHAYARPFGMASALADTALALPDLPADSRAAILSKLAEAGYLLNDPGYWNPRATHGSLCPNMFTSAAGYRLTVAALIPSHPMAKSWFNGALSELKEQLDNWVDPAGGMIECPHYSMVILHQWVGAFLIARNAGAPNDGWLYDPAVRRAIEWFGNITTPRDPQNGGFRRLPSLGHTYRNESTGMFGLMACLWREKDPAFAGQMQWLHMEQGAPAEPGILSYYPAFMGFRWFFTDSGMAPQVPSYSSRVYPETGVQFRNLIGSPRETTLYLIAGRNHSHYFNDSGSITLWGKGSELCDEDDYQNRRAPQGREAHSMVDKPATFSEERVMQIREFHASAHLDYASGVRRGWQRQIAFVKDQDPLGPNYFVLADTLDAKSVPTLWRLFVRANNVTRTPTGVAVTGREDVDMDVCFAGVSTATPEIQSNVVRVAIAQPGTLLTVLYPRLRGERPVQVEALPDRQGVRVVTPVGTDLVYLSPESIKAEVNGRPVAGRVCLVRERGGKTVVVQAGDCPVAPGWEGGDQQLRMIRWSGPQYPPFPDDEAEAAPPAGH